MGTVRLAQRKCRIHMHWRHSCSHPHYTLAHAHARPDTHAQVSQQAWIQSCTLRDNILFGAPYDEALYNRTLDAACLRHDISILPAGTERLCAHQPDEGRGVFVVFDMWHVKMMSVGVVDAAPSWSLDFTAATMYARLDALCLAPPSTVQETRRRLASAAST